MVKLILGSIVTIAMDPMDRSSGFTLLELIFVILILGTLSLIALRGYGNLQQRTQTESATMRVLEYMRLAYDKASASDKTATCETYAGTYSVSLSGSTMSLIPDGCSAVTSYTFSDFGFPEGDFQTTFQPLGKGITGDSCIVIEHPRADMCGIVRLETTGIASSVIESGESCVCP